MNDDIWSREQLAECLHDSRTVNQVVWLSEQIKHHKQNSEHAEMLAGIRAELCRLDRLQQQLFKAQNTINAISKSARDYWQP